MFYGEYDYELLVMLLTLAVIGAILLFLLHRWRQADAKRRGEQYFNLMAEAIPQIVWTAVPGRGMDYCNQRFTILLDSAKREVWDGYGKKCSIRTICLWP